jgi:CHASE3 domain sensor protein
LIFEAAVVFLALLWALSLWFFLNYSKRQRELAAQQAQGDALRDQRIKDLAKRLDDYQNGTVRMGEAIHELRAVLAPLPEKLQQLEQRDPNSVTFTQAAKLVGMGASIDELTRTCGLTQAEAELMSKLHRGE